jgi:hypothetical protein
MNPIDAVRVIPEDRRQQLLAAACRTGRHEGPATAADIRLAAEPDNDTEAKRRQVVARLAASAGIATDQERRLLRQAREAPLFSGWIGSLEKHQAENIAKAAARHREIADEMLRFHGIAPRDVEELGADVAEAADLSSDELSELRSIIADLKKKGQLRSLYEALKKLRGKEIGGHPPKWLKLLQGDTKGLRSVPHQSYF